MNLDLPKEPLILQIYYKIRQFFNVSYSIQYLTIESIIIGFFSIILINSLYSISVLYLPFLFIPFLIVSIYKFFIVSKDKITDEVYILQINFKSYLITLLFVFIPLILFYYLFNHIFITILASTIVILYITSIKYRGSKYEGERKFYTDEYSNVKSKWYFASVALEQSIKYERKNKFYRQYYWAKYANNIYNEIVEEENRYMLRKAANEFSIASQFIYTAAYVKHEEKRILIESLESIFKRASEYLKYRVCDGCNKKIDINKNNNYTINFDNNNNRKIIYCSNCHHKRNNENRNSYKRKKNNIVSMKEAENILGLQQPYTKKDVHKKFREKVKQTHPDIGGSVEEFKKVEKSRKRLLEELK